MRDNRAVACSGSSSRTSSDVLFMRNLQTTSEFRDQVVHVRALQIGDAAHFYDRGSRLALALGAPSWHLTGTIVGTVAEARETLILLDFVSVRQ